jgi:hypothetical protein
MDLNKIMHKINEGKYFRVTDFLRDISIIRYNTEFYHGADDDLTIRVSILVYEIILSDAYTYGRLPRCRHILLSTTWSPLFTL